MFALAVRFRSLVPAMMVACASTGLASPPPVFQDLDYTDALALSEEQGRLLVIDATAEWCAPCKHMDRTTWVDDRVVQWLNEHAVAIQIDVDEQPGVAQSLRIRGMPTVAVFRDGEEVGRVIGYRSADNLLPWLKSVESGDAANEIAAQADAGDIMARFDTARRRLDAGDYNEALDDYLWLWENAPTFGDGNDPFRTGLLGSEIGALTRIHEPSRKAFGEIRDALENRLRAGEANMSDLCGWVSLSVALDEEDEVIAWYERVRDDPEAHESIVQNEFVLRRLLTDRGRYADAGKVLENPIGEVITSLGAARMSRIDLPNASKDQLERINAMQAGAAKQGVAETYALCLAAGRLTEARRISELLLTNYDDADARIALVSRAVKYGAPMPEHRVLLDAAEKTGVDVAALRERLERALDSR